jgi:hypothetical protein
MTTYTENATNDCKETQYAIKRSISHDEGVMVICEDPAQLLDWIDDNYDAVDHATENDGDIDVWGERSGEPFRLRLRKES